MGAALLTKERRQEIITNYHNDSNIKHLRAQLNYILSKAVVTYSLSEDGNLTHYLSPTDQEVINTVERQINDYIKSAYPEMITPNTI